MLVYDEVSNADLQNVTILLDKNEILQLISYLEALVQSDTQNDHFHFSNDDYSKELTFVSYGDTDGLKHVPDKYKRNTASKT
ncbi:MAG: hypothetical protein FWD98_02255 [Defluviitaleaceae bacterium]|nr:hypothetical protein [Defluviitaleaceae bacterium]